MNEATIAEKVAAILERRRYIGYSTKKEFSNISGITLSDIDKKLFTDPYFRKRCLRRFEDGRTFYIDINEAMNYLNDSLKRGG